MATSEASLVLSTVAGWELRLKWHGFHVSGARKGPVHPGTVVAFAAAVGWEFLSVTVRHAAAELSHPLDHKDPFDELLLVQAQRRTCGFLRETPSLWVIHSLLRAEEADPEPRPQARSRL